ncbi:MAG: hypothetical protein B7X92_13120 [Novosphingobium sp. 17-62-9]|nr:MAG: hypothetical protein B7X92_13120 [Novosphingobium sp. 17-62-9]
MSASQPLTSAASDWCWPCHVRKCAKTGSLTGQRAASSPSRSRHQARRNCTISGSLPGRAASARRCSSKSKAAHGPRAARAQVDAVVVSAIFPSNSPSAGGPLGPLRLARIVSAARSPVYALGGVNQTTAARLLATGVVGIAGVEVFGI